MGITNSDNVQLTVQIDSPEIKGLQLPRKLNLSGSSQGSPFAAEVMMSDYDDEPLIGHQALRASNSGSAPSYSTSLFSPSGAAERRRRCSPRHSVSAGPPIIPVKASPSPTSKTGKENSSITARINGIGKTSFA